MQLPIKAWTRNALGVAAAIAFGLLVLNPSLGWAQSTEPGFGSDLLIPAATAADRSSAAEQRKAARAAFERGNYEQVIDIYRQLSDSPAQTLHDAYWLGYALHLGQHWPESRDAYQAALRKMDLQLEFIDQEIKRLKTLKDEPADDSATEVDRRGGSAGERQIPLLDREREQLIAQWPELVLHIGRMELLQLDDPQAAIKTLPLGLRFAPEGQLEKLTEAAKLALDKQATKQPVPATAADRPPEMLWFKLMMPMACQRLLAIAYERQGDHEAAARCWCQVRLSEIAHRVGMAYVDRERLLKSLDRVPADKRENIHELVRSNPGTHRDRYAHPTAPPPKDALKQPFTIMSQISGANFMSAGPAHASLVKLADGTSLMAYASGDIYQTRIMLAKSADGVTWEAPKEFVHNNQFPTRCPSMMVDDKGEIWMLFSSKRFDLQLFSSAGYQLWMCHSGDGVNWSPLQPVLMPGGLQYQNTAQLTRDHRGRYWIFSEGLAGFGESPADIGQLSPLKLETPKSGRTTNNLHATFDNRGRCHLVFDTFGQGLYYTSSDDMQTWQTAVTLGSHEPNSSIGHGQIIWNGDRAVLFHETNQGLWLRHCFGRDQNQQLTWTNPVMVLDHRLAIGRSSIVVDRSNSRILLPAGNGYTPAIIAAPLPEIFPAEPK